MLILRVFYRDSVPASTAAAIKKHKKPKKVKKIENNEQVAATVKKDFAESQSSSGEKLVSRQQRWNMYLIAFREHEKLPKKQRQIMEFCTNKSTTPPKRKIKFLVRLFFFFTFFRRKEIGGAVVKKIM